MSIRLTTLVLLTGFFLLPKSVFSSVEDFERTVKPFFQKHCVSCHGPEKKKGGLRIDEISMDLSDLTNVDHMLNIVDQMAVEEMPPEDEPQPDPELAAEVIRILNGAVELAQEKHRSGGGKPVRRLTRTEYINTVYDLLGVSVSPTALPADGSIGAFETEAAALYTTDMHLETYLNASRDVARRFIASRAKAPGEEEVRYGLNTQGLKQGVFTFDSVGKSQIPPAGYFSKRLTVWQRDPDPENRLYIGNRRGGMTYEVTGSPESPQEIAVPVFHQMPKSGFIFLGQISNLESKVVGYEVTGKRSDRDRQRALRDELKKVEVTPENFAEVQSLEVEHPIVLGGVKGVKVINPQPYEFFEAFPLHEDELPDETVRDILRRFVELVNRGRAIDPQLLNNLFGLYEEGLDQQENSWEALIEPMAVAMCSLQFLFHFENREGGSDSVSGVELANRLSFFLWRSAPDDELLEKGRSGALLGKDVLNTQLARLVKDQKFERFMEDFTRQWLELDRQDMIAVDLRLYPEFQEMQRIAFKDETIAFLTELIRGNLPLDNLIDSDFMVLNGMTATHYGIPGIRGDEFRVVPRRPEDAKRGGILTHAGILMQTTTGERTSIVERGVFVGEKLLNDEPPPPPANVEALPTENVDLASIRAVDMLVEHRRSPQCASCHDSIDPLGMGMEEFDVLGLPREVEYRIDPHGKVPRMIKGRPVSEFDYLEVELVTSGRVPDGETYEGIDGLKRALMDRREHLAESYIEALLTFANGRKTGAADGKVVEGILEEARPYNYPATSILAAVLRSSAFRPQINR